MSDALDLTDKQKEILSLVLAGSRRDDDHHDMDTLHQELSYTCSKQALQCSLRFLKRRGLVDLDELARRRGANRRIVKPTLLTYQVMRA